MKKAIKSILRESTAVVIMLAAALMFAVIIYAAGLTAFGIPASCAEEDSRCDVAMVKVHPGSSLNVRATPNGRIVNSLSRGADVVILDKINGWALVTTERDMVYGHNPLGWVWDDYLVVYRFCFVPKESGL